MVNKLGNKMITRNGIATYTFMQNLYIWFSKAVCRGLSEPLKTTEGDESELDETASVLHIDGDLVTWNPLERCIVPIKDIAVKYYSLKINNNSLNINESANNASDNFISWASLMVKLDKERHKSEPVNEFLARNRRDLSTTERHLINESSLHLDDQLKWLYTDIIWTPLTENMTNWLSINEPQYFNITTNWYQWHPSSLLINWHPMTLNESYKDPEESSVHKFMKDTWQRLDVTKNWYLVNESHVAIKRPNINIQRETKIIIHGFGSTATHEETKNIAVAYHELNMFNVLLVDVEVMFKKVYFKCVKNARLLGKAIAELIIHLVTFGAKAADFHLIGISLGAHAAGWAGKHYLHSTGRRLGRITGLDPAGPCFANMPRDKRLDKSDALYVDVIHSNSLIEGLFEPLGHADFYINGGGPFQPGCGFNIVCSHLTAAYVYTESISQPDLFIAVKCDNWRQFQDNQCNNETAILGNASLPDTRGMYYLRTSGERPYGLGIDGIIPKK
ncbi:lipase domain-containing protein [Phthorimaea operculella]|nr:lipase domain-containing protein [Phthorimaea operculella]